MIDPSSLPSWEAIHSQAGLKQLRRGRGECALCGNKTAFATYEDRRFKCFACGAAGDKLDFIQRYHKCDFKEALGFFGLSPSKPPAVDPAIVKRRQEEAARLEQAKRIGRRLRDEYLHRSRIVAHGRARLEVDPDDERGWSLLQVGYKGIDECEYLLDQAEQPKKEGPWKTN